MAGFFDSSVLFFIASMISLGLANDFRAISRRTDGAIAMNGLMVFFELPCGKSIMIDSSPM